MSDEIISGLHAVTRVLCNTKREVSHVFIQADRQDARIAQLQALAYDRQVRITKLSKQALAQRFPEHHQGVVAMASQNKPYTEKDLPALLADANKPLLILILDGVTDPHNLGACLRTAEASGVDFVITPKDNSASLGPTVSQVACGAADIVPLVSVTNLSRVMKTLKQQGVWLYGAAGEASQSLYQLDFKGSVGLVMGAEGRGMRRLTREQCDGLFAIPMQGHIESLNVSVATGVCLYETRRQRELA